MTPTQKAARAALRYFSPGGRHLRANAPQWVQRMVFRAHGGTKNEIGIDDDQWTMGWIREALQLLSVGDGRYSGLNLSMSLAMCAKFDILGAVDWLNDAPIYRTDVCNAEIKEHFTKGGEYLDEVLRSGQERELRLIARSVWHAVKQRAKGRP